MDPHAFRGEVKPVAIALPPPWSRYHEFIGVALRLMRVKKGIRQIDLAAAISKDLPREMKQTSISKLEKSKKGLSWERLGLICKHLGCTPKQVIEMAEALAIEDARPECDVLADLAHMLSGRLPASKVGGKDD